MGFGLASACASRVVHAGVFIGLNSLKRSRGRYKLERRHLYTS